MPPPFPIRHTRSPYSNLCQKKDIALIIRSFSPPAGKTVSHFLTEINFSKGHAGGSETEPGRLETGLAGVRFSAVAHNQ